MILIGLEHCPGCSIVRANFPNVNFIEVPRNATKENNNVKRILDELGLADYPIVLNDAMNQALPLTALAETK